MSDQTVVMVWFSFLVAVVAITVIGKPKLVEAVVKELARILLSIFQHGP